MTLALPIAEMMVREKGLLGHTLECAGVFGFPGSARKGICTPLNCEQRDYTKRVNRLVEMFSVFVFDVPWMSE